MRVGYARTSTVEQEAGFEAQLRDLRSAGCEKIFQEQVSSVAEREELERALDFVREGDTLTVTRLDRLARSVLHLGQIIDRLKAKQVALSIINLGIDTNTATGKLILHLMGGVAEFERSVMLERQREGVAKAKAEGKYKGRTPTAMRQAAAVVQLHQEGTGPAEIARRLGIGRSSVYRILSQPPRISQPPVVRLQKADLPSVLAGIAQEMQATYEATSGRRKRH